MSLDPDLEKMRSLGYAAVDRAVEHLAGLAELPVARPPVRETLDAVVREPLPEQGAGLEACVERFFDRILPHATLVNHPRFFAYIPGPGSFAGALGNFIAATTNSFVGTFLGGSVMTQLELQVLEWLRQALRLPQGFTGVLTSGGSMANLSALGAARARGLSQGHALEKLIVYASEQTHYSVAKAASVLGFGRRQVRVLPTDDGQTLPPRVVQEGLRRDRDAGLQPLALCATLGTTNTGAVDPLPELGALCAEEGLWFHVDAAYGGAIALLEEERSRSAAGLSGADSITLDPHKWLYAPFESGCLLTPHETELRAAFTADGDYMQDVPRDEVNFFERGPELSRGNRALKLWMMFRGLGVQAIRDAIREDLRLCRLACELLREDPRIDIVTEPRLSIFSFARRDADEQEGRGLVQRLLADGHLMLSSTIVNGRFVLRFCVVNHRTTEADIRSSVSRIRELL